MKEITAIQEINKNYSPVINGVLTQWERREGAVVFRATAGNSILDQLGDLFEANLPQDGLGPGVCSTCHSFINTYGDLVYHNRKGEPESALWNPDHVPPKYKALFRTMRDFVLRAYHAPSQRGEFKDSYPAAAINQNILPYFAEERVVGKMQHGNFNHFYLIWGDESYDAGKERAKYNDGISFIIWFLSDPKRVKRLERMREYVKVTDVLAENNKLIAALDDMTNVLGKWKEHKLQSSEDFAQRQERIVGYARGNAHLMLSEGTKQLRGGAASVFFENVETPDDISMVALAQFLKMTDPENYKRITKDFNERTLRNAEKLMTDAGLDKTLLRRCVYKGESLPFIWEKEVTEKARNLSFLANLEGQKSTVNTAADREHRKREVSWTTFVDKYLPRLKEMWLVPPANANYGGLMTAAEPEAPNIFIWDGPLSAWFYTKGSHPRQWNLKVGELVPVKGVMFSPEHTGGFSPLFDHRHLLVLDDGYHAGPNSPALFKDYLDRYKFDYNQLANIGASFNERISVDEDKDAVVVYSVAKRSPNVVLFAELDRVWTRFEIKTWE